jgi:hypothetical protein
LSSPAACTLDSEAVGNDGHYESPEHYEEQDGDKCVARHIEGTAKKNAMKALAIDAHLVQRPRGSSVMIGSEECQAWASRRTG